MTREALEVTEKKDGTLIKKDIVLFVCTGNTCRSPMCAALFNDRYAGFTRRAVSAGLAADGSPISENAVRALESRGIISREGNDYKAHISKNVTESMLEEADIVVGMTSAHAMRLIFAFPRFASKINVMPAEISDPYGGDLSDYEKCLQDIDKALAKAFGIKPADCDGSNENEDNKG